MSELLTAAQMRAVETAAIESGDVTGLELMERAGRGVVEAIFEEWPELAKTAHQAVVLCGPGNNGGDGFVIARLLKEWGWEVEVFLFGDAEKLPPDAKANHARWCEMGVVALLTEDAIDGYAEANPQTRIAVDALFGTGLVRPFAVLDRVQMELNYWRAASNTPGSALPHVVSVDLPSGLCADSGVFLGVEDNPFDQCVMSNLAVSFHARKLGHYLAQGATACGKVVVKDIGLQHGAWSQLTDEHDNALSADQIVELVEAPSFRVQKSGAHKYSHGHALILSGGAGKSGAARLAARGALRIGAGLVTLGVPHEAQDEVAAQITALMMCGVGDAGALSKTLKDTRLNALCLGPGLGLERARELVPVALASDRATVLDADALSAFEDRPDALFDRLHATCVLTPHEGEFRRLFPDLHAKLIEVPGRGPAYSRVDATRDAAALAGCVVLLKGPDTVIAAPDGRCRINAAQYDRAAPGLATAGSGDVLAGFITGLLARGLPPLDAAASAAWLHVECARTFGPGLIAEDLPEQLPAVLRNLDL